MDILPRYLDLGVFTSDIVIAVLQCLFVVVEDNPVAMAKVKSNAEKQLQSLLGQEGNDPEILLMKILSSGVIINTCGGNITVLPPEVINQILSTLAATLAIDHRFVCNQLSSSVPLKDPTGVADTPKDKAAKQLENQLKSVSHMLSAQQSSLEIIANICSGEGKPFYIYYVML